ncbi:hypothetical protein L9F63_011126 [Diploptera punctata]|uniref:Uncharacterized protein n=1 Tax=Diploptera punctata TaxID=6984 RepID=A0AAD8AFK4_DIPPU|nr:hypothetical protein L9F63_011126 [Diploptera punctata]
MPRRGRNSPPPRAPPARSSARSSSTYSQPPAVQHAPPTSAPTVTQAAQPQQPGLFKQMAATAGGVAVGSAVPIIRVTQMGHALTGMFGGGGSGSEVENAPSQQQQQYPAQYHNQDQNGPCAYEIKQFLQCAEGQSDLTLCEGFNEAIRQCKRQYKLYL